MKYGKSKHGMMWHIILNDKALCNAGMQMKSVVLKEKSELTDNDHVCRICDNHLRAKGKGAAAKSRPNPKENYRPRNKFEDS